MSGSFSYRYSSVCMAIPKEAFRRLCVYTVRLDMMVAVVVKHKIDFVYVP